MKLRSGRYLAAIERGQTVRVMKRGTLVAELSRPPAVPLASFDRRLWRVARQTGLNVFPESLR